MPAATSSSPRPYASSSSAYATLSFHKTDTIRLLHFPEDITSSLHSVILSSWPPGIESNGPFGEAHEYKVKGSPFGYYRSQQYVGGIRLVRDLLAFMYSHSWELVTPLLCSRRYTAKDTLIFRQVPIGSLPPVEWLALAPSGSDKLRVIYDADGVKLFGVDADHDHLGSLITAIKKMLEGLDYFEKGDWSHDSFEFDFKGKPWRSRGEASVKMRIMLMRLLETMEGHGWRLHTAIVQRTGTDEHRMLDTWYFVREYGRARRVDVGNSLQEKD